MNYKQHTQCRVCGSVELTKYLDLGMLPLSNNLCDTQEEDAPKYPLQVMLCDYCGLSQLSIVVEPELLFGNYVYRSGISSTYKNHCRQMAFDLKREYGLNSESFMIDIAGNDGTLLKEFKDEIGLKVLNIDPAKNLIKANEELGVRVYNSFWGKDAAEHLINTGWQKVNLITATNVFAHVDNVYEFLDSVTKVLSRNGVLVMEFPYLIDFIENNEFDTVYFEHLSYFSIYPLVYLCAGVGLNVMKVEKQNIHGGTVRVHIGTGKEDGSVNEYIEKEIYYKSDFPYKKFSENAEDIILDFGSIIKRLKKEGNKISAFAASAKGNTLLNCSEITSEQVDYIIDETPEKIGKYSPGTHIPILSIEKLVSNPPDYLIVLSWNFLKDIKDKCRKVGYKGKFIIPIPSFKIID